jgi:phosphoribosylaminoimidazole-succinocarboxamide synthase
MERDMPEELLYEGKAKKLFITEDPQILRVEYKDDATAFNGKKFDRLRDKGRLNNAITVFFFEHLDTKDIPSHFVRKISETEQLVRRVKIIPLEVVVRNVAAGSLSKRIGWEEGKELPHPIVEFYYKDDDLGDPLLAEEHIRLLELASEAQIEELKKRGLAVNEALKSLMLSKGIRLIVSAGIWVESLKPIWKSINASRKRLHERHHHRGPQTGHSGSTRTSRDELASGSRI